MKKLDVTTITQKTVIPKASPKQVYDAYIDPVKHSDFTDAKATGKPVVGGKFTAWDGYIFGRYLELQEAKRIVQEWSTIDWEEGYPASKVELTLTAVPGGTEINLVHSNVPKAQTEEIEQGWIEFYWEPLKEYFADEK